MLKFTQLERRDFMPVFDVMVLDISDQGSMKVKADIKYKSNWQQGALKGTTPSTTSPSFVANNLLFTSPTPEQMDLRTKERA